MYHIYLDEEAVNTFALELVKSEPFRDGTYTLYADVPVKCFGYEAPFFLSPVNLTTMDSSVATQTVDFVVVRGTQVVLGITTEILETRSRQLFERVLKPMTHIPVPSDGTPREKYIQLYHSVLEALEKQTESCFSLTPFPVELSAQELKQKRLLHRNGNVSAYGRAQGLFFRYGIGEDGSLAWLPISSTVACRDYLQAANWLRSGSHSALQALLDTSIGELFRDHSGQWNQLNDTMAALSQLQSYPSFAPCDILEDYPELVYRLRCRVTGTNPENQQIMLLTDRLLSCIAGVLADERTVERFEILRAPLHCYFEEAALRSGLYYPEWMYHNSIRPFLNETRSSQLHTLQGLLAHRNHLPHNAACPGLAQILLEPLYTPALLGGSVQE